MTFVCVSQEAPANWKIESPYPNNPLKQALLSGNASHSGLNTKSELQIECRADADGPRMNLVFTPAGVKFDADPFEGPGGLGERRKLRVSLGRNEWPHHFSGYYVESNSFVFSFALLPAEARQITSAASEQQELTITVDPAKEGAPLQFHFTLSAPSDPVRKMVAPCLGTPHKS
jgi:hypothetical protein